MKGRLRYSIDAIGFSRTVGMTGWAVHDRAEITALFLQSEGLDRRSCRRGLSRPDVGDALPKCPGAAQSGFTAGGLLAEGTISLVARLADGHEITEPICRVERGEIVILTRHAAGIVVRPQGRDDPDLSHMAALLRVHRRVPKPLPAPHTPILVIVPVYGGATYLRPFFQSLFAHSGDCRIVIVDDGNRDSEVLSILAEAGEDSRATVIRNEVNGGFVEAVRAAFAAWRGDEHLVIANTDIVLPEGWLPRLVAPLDRDDRAASVTPFSNCGTICSFPAMPEDNPLFLDLEPGAIDEAFRHIESEALAYRLPTGVGFCMAMSRRALAEIGFFEAGTFGLGYGEENDWCRKAIAAGFHHLLGVDLFVYHAHGGSFSSESKQALMRRNLAIIRQRYPEYEAEVSALTLFDPWRPLRGFIAFILAADTHPHGAVVRLVSEGSSDGGALAGRPALRVEFSRSELKCRYFLSWPGGELVLEGGNLAELDELFGRVAVGEFFAEDLTGCRIRPSAERLAKWAK